MIRLLLLFFLFGSAQKKEIEIKGLVETCVHTQSSFVKMSYEIANNTTKDYYFDIYALQSKFEIENKEGEIIKRARLIELVVKIDTSKYLVKHRYIFVKANTITKFSLQTGLFQAYSLQKATGYKLISNYNNRKSDKVKSLPVYKGTLEIEPIKFITCSD